MGRDLDQPTDLDGISQRGPVASQVGRTCLSHKLPLQRTPRRRTRERAVCRAFALGNASGNGTGEGISLSGAAVFPFDVDVRAILGFQLAGARYPLRTATSLKSLFL